MAVQEGLNRAVRTQGCPQPLAQAAQRDGAVVGDQLAADVDAGPWRDSRSNQEPGASSDRCVVHAAAVYCVAARSDDALD